MDYQDIKDGIFYSAQMQDIFALGLLKENKTFLDIGSGGPIRDNNTYLLEKKGWTGICVDDLSDEREDTPSLYEKERKSKFFKIDATSKDFIELLNQTYPSKMIDYISLDVDENGILVLQNLLKNGFNFKCMTYEHDIYNNKGVSYINKYQSKDLLVNSGYFPVFENVCLFSDGGGPWEDWWINLNYFSMFRHCSAMGLKFDKCINKLFNFLRAIGESEALEEIRENLNKRQSQKENEKN